MNFDAKWKELGDINILVVEDDPFNQLLVKSLLGKLPQIHIFEAYDGLEALDVLQSSQNIDIILLDLHMPNMNGREFLDNFKERDRRQLTSKPAIFIMTTDEDEKKELYTKGADGFISKPFDLEELESKIYQMITLNMETKEEDRGSNNELINHSNNDIERSQRDFFCRLMVLKTKSETEDKLRIQIIANVAKEFALIAGYSLKVASDIYCASQIRDIGLIGFAKTEPHIKFSVEEKHEYNQYILCGYQMMISHIETDFLRVTKKIILQYKESFDGTGVPYHLKGSQISKKAMIVAMAETFEALLATREYREKRSYTPQETYNIFKSESGKRFHPELTILFIKHFYFFIKLRKSILLKR